MFAHQSEINKMCLIVFVFKRDGIFYPWEIIGLSVLPNIDIWP